MTDNRGVAAGLRERKKQKTRAAIQREAMRLFQAQGYEATTIEQIADAAEISPSTFFHYFPSKEDVVLTDDYDPLFVRLLGERPPEEPLSDAIRRVLVDGLGAILERDRDIVLARAKLVLRVPALRARILGDLEQAQDLLREILAQRTGRDPDDFELRVIAHVLIGAMYAANVEWVRSDGRADMMELVNRALDVVDAGARLESMGAPRP